MDSSKSKLQLRTSQLFKFDYQANPNTGSGVTVLSQRLIPSLSVRYDKEQEVWLGFILMDYAAQLGETEIISKSDENTEAVTPHLHTHVGALFEFDADNTAESEDILKALLRLNGAFSLLSIMRGQIAAATAALGASKPLLLPFFNLAELSWEEAKNQ